MTFTMNEISLRECEKAAYRLLRKFHREAECGNKRMHWAECEGLVDAFGWVSWEAWDRSVRGLSPGSDSTGNTGHSMLDKQ